jgi:hypothetical protein
MLFNIVDWLKPLICKDRMYKLIIMIEVRIAYVICKFVPKLTPFDL